MGSYNKGFLCVRVHAHAHAHMCTEKGKRFNIVKLLYKTFIVGIAWRIRCKGVKEDLGGVIVCGEAQQ